EDVTELCYHEAEELLVMTSRVANHQEAAALVQRTIQSGAAVKKLAEIIAAQGGDAQQIEQTALLPAAPLRVMLTAPQDGYIAAIAAEQIGMASMKLGAGRFKKGDPVDHRTGLVLQAKVGAYLHAGDPLV